MIAKLANILQLAPLFKRFRLMVETGEIPLEDSVRTLAYASELVVLKLRWLLPNTRQEDESSEEGALAGADELIGATASPVMEPWEVAAAVRAVEDRMKAFALMIPRGYAPSYEGGRRLEIVNIDPSGVRDAMLLVERRNDGASRTYVVSRWSFVTHLRDFWREVRRLTSKGAIIRFSRFLGKTRQEAILNFLAFLELVRRRRLFARQTALFGDIEFSTTRESVEREERVQP